MQVLVAADQTLTEKLSDNGKEESRKIVDEIENILKSVEVAEDNDEEHKEHAKERTIDENKSYKHPIYQHTPFPGISQLLPDLFLCGAGVAMPQILDQLDVSFIINVAPELPDTPLSSITKPLYLRVNAMDRPEVELCDHFDEVADMIEEVRQHGGKSLIHCVAGVSRSASLCIAYLMKHEHMSLRAAYLHVKAIRPQIRPNTGFFQQLRRYEEQLFGSSSVKMVFYASLNKEIPDVYEPEYRAMEEFYQRQRKALKRS